MEKDKRLAKLDLEKIQEAGRRLGEIALEGRMSQDVKMPSSRMTVNPTCERTWAVVLYNTGIVEMVSHCDRYPTLANQNYPQMDGNNSIAEEYLQLALEHSRRTNLLEGVSRSKAALTSLLSKDPKSGN